MAFWNKKDGDNRQKTKRQKDAEVQAVESERAEEVKVALPKGGDAGSFSLIIQPHVTEKAALMNEKGKYVFLVSRGADKVSIKKAVEKMYKTKIEKINVVNTPAKTRQIGRTLGVKSGYRKAIVTLKKGEKIDLISR